jgi:hypothetical protein
VVAIMLVASGHGLIEVRIPNQIAENAGIRLLSMISYPYNFLLPV